MTDADGVPPVHHFPGPGTLDRAVRLVRHLREHCAWDREQTAESLIPHLLEETHEVVDAIREGTPTDLEDELGDLLLNLAFQIVVAEEAGTMDSDSIYARLEEKMIRRHPHVFGDGEPRDWEASKAAERGEADGVLAGLAGGLDPLTKAYRIQERVAAVGFDWEDYRGAYDKVVEELREVAEAVADRDLSKEGAGSAEPAEPSESASAIVRIDEEVGDLLFAAVNLARLLGAHPTTALARANGKFVRRFERLEALARERRIDLESAGLPALDALWEELKREGRAASPSQ